MRTALSRVFIQRWNGRGRSFRTAKGTIDTFSPPEEFTLASRAASTEPKRKPRQRNAPEPNPHFPIVGVGASAGGLEPFLDVLRNVPADSGLAIIYLQHSDVSHNSALPQVLGRATKMPVQLAVDATVIRPNVVHVAPPAGARPRLQ